ncbi:MAG: hypothetical protein ACI8W8_002121 [Rhodothermales bacterium]|jgi:hypothetical protein
MFDIHALRLILALFFLAGAGKAKENPEPVDQQVALHMAWVGRSSEPGAQSSFDWLRQQGAPVKPQLLAGLNSSFYCLHLLDLLPPDSAVRKELLQIARDPTQGFFDSATASLSRYADHPESRMLLEAAYQDRNRLRQDYDRARVALALGHRQPTEQLLLNSLRSWRVSLQTPRIIDLLVDLHEEAEVPELQSTLETLMNGPRLRSAYSIAIVHLALTDIAPDAYPVSDSLRTFLAALADRRVVSLALIDDLDREECHPVIMRMLQALEVRAPDTLIMQWAPKTPVPDVLIAWQDLEALPELAKLAARGGPEYSRLANAYLQITNDNMLIEALLTQLKGLGARYLQVGGVLQVFLNSGAPTEKKLHVLEMARRAWGPIRLGGGTDRESIAALDLPRLKHETELQPLASYAQRVRQLTGSKADQALQRAATLATTAAKAGTREWVFVGWILDAAAGRVDAATVSSARPLLADPNLRMAAANFMAHVPAFRGEAHAILLADFAKSYHPYVHRQYLDDLLPLNEPERARREAALLAHFSTPSEQTAMLALVSCLGETSTAKLRPLLDEPDVRKAALVAWILTHHTDAAVKQEATRRLAIFSLFHHVRTPSYEGIRVSLADHLDLWRQITGDPATMQRAYRALEIPEHLLKPFSLSRSEQEFAIRAYRELNIGLQEPSDLVHAVDLPGWWQNADETYYPLLRVIAEEDQLLVARRQGKERIADFPMRRRAAQHLSAETNEAATYLGLFGEEIAADRLPAGAYPDQIEALATIILNRLASVSSEYQKPGVGFSTSLAGQVHAISYASRSLCSSQGFGSVLADRLKLLAPTHADLDQGFLRGIYPWNTGP